MSDQFKDFRSAVKRVTGLDGDALHVVRARIKQAGVLSCPPPEWDADGVYRIALGPTNLPEVQRLGEDNRWAESPLRPQPASSTREKHQKFGILDAPSLLATDLATASDPCAVIFLDVDDFKTLNTKLTERVVDRTILPDLQRRVLAAVKGHGFAYAEGGDEMIVLLPNMTELTAVAFAESLRQSVEATTYTVDDRAHHLTLSFGVASSTRAARDRVPDLANLAKAVAKQSGKNVVCLWHPDGPAPYRVKLEKPSERQPAWKGVVFR